MYRSQQPLTNDQIQRYAPSVFAREPWHAMSAKYAFIPTSEVVDKMRTEGFLPVAVAQARTRIPGKGDFTRHVLRFRDFRQGAEPVRRELGMVFPELILTNSHDGASAYKLDAGLYRLVCLNGLTVSMGEVSHINVRHSGDAGAVIDASYEVIEQFPRAIDSAASMNALRLTSGEQSAFATAALALRYDATEAPIVPQQLLRVRRREDMEPTVWTTMNVVQEHLTQGGDRGRSASGRRTRTRAISSLVEDSRINRALWTLAEEMRKLKA